MIKFAKKRGFGRLTLLILLVLLVGLPVTVLALISEQRPLVTKKAHVDTHSAVNAKEVIKRFYWGLVGSETTPDSQIDLSEKELNEILALAVRGIPTAKSRVKVEADHLRAELTISVKGNPLGGFINVVAVVEPFKDGFKVTRISIGDLKLSGRLVLATAEQLLNWRLEGQTLGSELLASLDSLSIQQKNIRLDYRPVPDFEYKVKQLKAQMQLGDEDLLRIRTYYQQLCLFNQNELVEDNDALAPYLAHIFDYAQAQSVDNLQASQENRAALLALALFLGTERFDTVIGALDAETRRNCKPVKEIVVLANRNDLRLHFIFSAALQVISNSGVSFSIGEFKELLDSGDGGSGFSFADLAADRAGIRFAEFAVAKKTAIRLQGVAEKLVREEMFFPSIEALPEGIGHQDFEQRGGLESDFYQAYLALIDRRIAELPLYQKP